jgi:phosphatidylserine/phosphatidylglycerophosphate/cardiolipin synthase-like enzyme
MKRFLLTFLQRLSYAAAFFAAAVAIVLLHTQLRACATCAALRSEHAGLLTATNQVKAAYFSPDDDVKNVVIDLIASEEEELLMAAYAITCGDITKALIKAHEKGVRVSLVVDGAMAVSEYSKVSKLCQAGIPIYLYQPSMMGERFASKMHHKFILFKKAFDGRPLLLTGSFNYTRSAAEKNQENILILDDTDLIQAYKNQFELLIKRCHLLSATTRQAGAWSSACAAA